MLSNVEKDKLEILISAANKGEQQAIIYLQILFGHVSEFEDINKKREDC
ncbi:hypothetical protein ACT7DB_07965 [Bacillus cereus]